MASLLEEIQFREIQPAKKCESENFLPTHTRHWLPRGSSTWRCEICQPPPKPIMVAQRRDTAAPHAHAAETNPHAQTLERAEIAHTRTQPQIIAHEHPVCTHCGCSWSIETYGTEGYSRCWSCKRAIDVMIKHASITTARRLLPWAKG